MEMHEAEKSRYHALSSFDEGKQKRGPGRGRKREG